MSSSPIPSDSSQESVPTSQESIPDPEPVVWSITAPTRDEMEELNPPEVRIDFGPDERGLDGDINANWASMDIASLDDKNVVAGRASASIDFNVSLNDPRGSDIQCKVSFPRSTHSISNGKPTVIVDLDVRGLTYSFKQVIVRFNGDTLGTFDGR